MNPLLGQKSGQIALAWFVEDGQVAAIDHLHALLPSCPHQISELGMQFRSASGEIKNPQLQMLQHLRDQSDVAVAHHFRAPRPSIHVAMAAALIAAVAQVHLQGLQMTAG